jgi:hypothetical protein
VGGPVRGQAPRTGGDARLDDRLRALYDGIATLVRVWRRKVTVADLTGKSKTPGCRGRGPDAGRVGQEDE